MSRRAYQRALRLLPTGNDRALPISITNEMLVYVLQAVGRFAEANAIITALAFGARQLGPAALAAEIRAVLESSDKARRRLY